MFRIVLVISLIVIAHSAPSPYYTRSLVRTPTSQVEQYVIVPDKNDPYKVPMSQVHDYKDFKFPKRQIFYYNPESQSSSLQEMSEDSSMWQNVMDMMKRKPDELPMKKMNMMQESEAALESEMMANVDSMSSKLSQRETRLMTEAIMNDNRNDDMIEKPLIISDDVNAKMTQDDAIREELISVMSEEKMSDARKQKMVDLLEAITTKIMEEQGFINEHLKVETVAPIDMEMSQREAKAIDVMTVNEEPEKESEAISNVENESVPTDVEVIRENSPENNSETQKNLPLSILAENEDNSEIQETEKPKSIAELMQEILKINEASLNVLEMMKLIDQTTTVSPAVKEEVEKITESIRSESQVEINCNKTEPVMSSEVMNRIIELLSNIEGGTTTSTAPSEIINGENMNAETDRVPKMMELEVISSDAQGENMEIKVVEVMTESIRALSENVENSSAERITSNELKATEPTTSETSLIKSESTTETPANLTSEVNEANDESTVVAEKISSRDNSNENGSASEQESMEQDVNARQGRMNESPTLFVHNNRFYVVSGAPEFYANFDAYQRLRTPIFSLEELQPIRPMQKNVRVQKVEPFRIYVDEEKVHARNDDESNGEPLKLDDNDSARDIENQSMISMEVKKPEQASAERELSDDSSVAIANPDAVAIAGKGGVASVKPQGMAVTNEKSLSVASPQATAIAGDFNTDDFKKKRIQLRRLRKVQKL